MGWDVGTGPGCDRSSGPLEVDWAGSWAQVAA